MIKKVVIILVVIIFIGIIYYRFYILNNTSLGNTIEYYTNSDFGITTYISNVDMDNDGIDDQSDILASAREYISTNPKYESKYYEGGYSTDEYGVCTDVVANALLNSGYDLRVLVNEDILNNRDLYDVDIVGHYRIS